MHTTLLARLRCPFCGSALSLVEHDALVRHEHTIEAGVLGCACCAFPVVAGIPVLLADDRTREAMHALEAGHGDDALALLLDLDPVRRTAFHALRTRSTPLTYREAIEVLSPDAEGTYFVYRFSDPTFRIASSVLTAVMSAAPAVAGWALDVCGGSGHLTRVLAGALEQSGGHGRTVTADLYFWKLWLARHLTVPGCLAVCCDANQPLPFAAGSFSTVVLSDAFPYIWHKRLLADELVRQVAADGVLVLPHLHSALGENHSAGMTLTPEAYASLFAALSPRLYRDADLLDGIVDGGVVDLSGAVSAAEAGDTPSITMVASRSAHICRAHRVEPSGPIRGTLHVNPLYTVRFDGTSSVLELTFPTPEYEEEFGDVRRYLPDTLSVRADLRGSLNVEVLRRDLGAEVDELRRRLVVLDLPPYYC